MGVGYFKSVNRSGRQFLPNVSALGYEVVKINSWTVHELVPTGGRSLSRKPKTLSPRWKRELNTPANAERAPVLESPSLHKTHRRRTKSGNLRKPLDPSELSGTRHNGRSSERKSASLRKTQGMAPGVGFEPTTNRLTADRSTTELPRNCSAAGGNG